MLNISNSSEYYSVNVSMRIYTELKMFVSFRVFLAIITLGVLTVGIVGNTVSFFVFTHSSIKKITDLLLSVYCISSCMALIGLLFNQILYGLFFYYRFVSGVKFIMMLYPYTYPITVTFQMSCIWLTVAVSTVQFLIVLFKKSKSQLDLKMRNKDIKHGLVVSGTIFIFSSIYCLPYWFVFEYTEETGLRKTSFGKNELYNKIIYFWLYFPCAYFGPLLILLVTNSYLISTVIITSKKKQLTQITIRSTAKRTSNQLSNQLKKTFIEAKLESENMLKLKRAKSLLRRKRSIAKKTQLMLIAHILFFFACQLPNFILHCLTSFDFKINQYYKEIANFLLIFNLSFNFLIYYLFNEKFRIALRGMIN